MFRPNYKVVYDCIIYIYIFYITFWLIVLIYIENGLQLYSLFFAICEIKKADGV